MITIKEIIILVNNYGLKKAVFMSSDSSNLRIVVEDGVAWFHAVGELDSIDAENNYYLPETYRDWEHKSS
jgi:hypothetical protein